MKSPNHQSNQISSSLKPGFKTSLLRFPNFGVLGWPLRLETYHKTQRRLWRHKPALKELTYQNLFCQKGRLVSKSRRVQNKKAKIVFNKQNPNIEKVKKNAMYYDKIQHTNFRGMFNSRISVQALMASIVLGALITQFIIVIIIITGYSTCSTNLFWEGWSLKVSSGHVG